MDVPSSEKRGRTTSISEQPLKVPTVIIDDKNDATTSQKHEEPPDSRTQSHLHQSTPQNLVVPSIGDIPGVVQGTDDIVTTSGTPLHGNVLIPEANASGRQAPPDVTEEPHGTENVLSSTGTSVPSGEKGLLKGKFGFRFAFSLALTLRLRYFPRILSA